MAEPLPSIPHRRVCPECKGNDFDWTVPDSRGYRWTIKFTRESGDRCTRCANPEHPARGLPVASPHASAFIE